MENKKQIENKTLKVLVLEDSLRDLELIIELLTDSGYILDLVHVEDESGFTSALNKTLFNIILSDFKLPTFDAFGALEISKKICPEVPFICISGSIGEETAIELLKQGAVDYVMKDRQERLPFAVKRALEESKEKSAHIKVLKNLLESETRFRQVAETAQEWIWEVDMNGLYTYTSPVVQSLLGYFPEELVGKKYFYDSFIPEKREELKNSAFEIFNRKVTFRNFENQNIHKNGHIVFLSTSGSPILDDNGKLIGYRGVDEDITDRKWAEKALMESEKIFRKLFDESSDPILLIDSSGVFVECNQASLDLLKTTREKFLYSQPTSISPEFQLNGRRSDEEAPKMIQLAYDKGLHRFDWIHINSENEEFIVEVSLMPIVIKGQTMLHTSWRNITQRIKTEIELKEAKEKAEKSEERFNMAMNASTDGIFDRNLETNEIYFSPGWKKMLGYDDHELPNNISVWEKLTDPKDLEKVTDIGQKLVTKQIDRYAIEFKMKHKEGHWVDILSRAEAFFNESGKAVRMVGTHTDITERKKAEQELVIAKEKAEESETKQRKLSENLAKERILLRTIVDSIPDAIYVKDLEYRKVLANKADCPNCDLEKEEDIIGKTDFDVFPAELAKRLLDDDKKVIEEGIQVVNREERLETPDYNEKWFLTSKLPLFDNTGKIIGLVGIGRDITERKQAEKKLKLLNQAIQSSSVSVVITNREGIIEYVNPFCEISTGYSYNELIGSNPRVLKSGNQSGEFYENLWNTILSGKNWEGEFQNRKKNGDIYWEKAIISPIVNNNGNITNFVAIKEDVTERKRILEELVAAKEKAEESDKLKSAFLANMSHEIRTPMNGILGFAELLKEPELTGEQQKYFISIIEKSGARMLNIINDIVDISKIESGQMKLEKKETNINEQLDYIYNFFKPEVEAKGIQFSYISTLPLNKVNITTDSEKIYAVLTNLVKNAIKYTIEGSIEFGYNVKIVPNTENTGIERLLEFYVKDTGIGIPKDREKAIFERFIQADITDKMARQGAGLGLAISKAYIEMLGGKIWVESELGKGSTFYFTLPFVPNTLNNINSRIENIEQTENIEIKNLKILIAEDDESSKELLSFEIGNYCREILLAGTGTEAIKICRANPNIDLIFMDIQLPEMSGYEAVRHIRQFNTDVLIIAITAFALNGDKEKAIDAGCNGYISKPVTKRELSELIQKYFNR